MSYIDTSDSQLPVEQWLQLRKDEGKRSDPENAEVMWNYAQALDPYGVNPNLPGECRQIGREYFEVSQTLAAGEARHLEQAELKAARVLEELRRIAFFDYRLSV